MTNINSHACVKYGPNGHELTGMGRIDCDDCDLHEITYSQDELNEKWRTHLAVHREEFAALGCDLSKQGI
jgi:hypothetical protein